MGRYKIEVTEHTAYSVTLEADSPQEALEAAQRHEGESVQAAAPSWTFGKPKRMETYREFSETLETKKTAKR
ncbi:MAG TPA: hypothetical protein PKE57_00285 [Cellvibrionaceae bacterium]|nr:hypothetical protein [Cellvibrionaceae bacterium]HMW49391.1 hypothetical protein [Cellvibrionaceae bacterium]HMW71326.1 hypothetical protein [Cellvibrionaceae bacterium]HMY41175.1 hypothetical protein [Marinagarivorans sp.]HNG61686.1 hypothetical protein [Cellvibrionaceae bacterium]